MAKRGTIFDVVFFLLLTTCFPVVSVAQEEHAGTTGEVQQDRSELIWRPAPALVPVRLLFPPQFDGQKKHTLIVALHGFGSSADEFRHVGEQLASAGFLVAIPESPYAFQRRDGKLGFDWTLYHVQGDGDLGKEATSLLVKEFFPDIVAQVRQRYGISKAYVLGFSQGAIVALISGICNHQSFDGVVTFGLSRFKLDWFPGEVLASSRDEPVLIIHGDNDQRAALSVSTIARDQLAEAGLRVTLHSFAGGHSVPDDQLELVTQWINNMEH